MTAKDFDAMEVVYGNGTMYIADQNGVATCKERHFKIDSVCFKKDLQYEVKRELIVALGCQVSRRKAVKLPHDVVKKLEWEMDCDASESN